MGQAKSERVFSIIAGVLFLLCGIHVIRGDIAVASGISITVTHVLWWIFFASMAILLFIGKKNIGFLLVSGMGAGLCLYYLIYYLFQVPSTTYMLKNYSDQMFYLMYSLMYSLMVIIAYILLFVYFLVITVPSLSKKTDVIKNVCFLPAIFFIIGWVMCWNANDFYFRHFRNQWVNMLFNVIEAAGFLFIGLWLKSILPEKEPSVGSQNSYTVYQTPPNGNPYMTYRSQPNGNPYTPYQPQSNGNPRRNVLGEADKLKAYKELLDSGVLTQEEFDAKKKEILGL